MSRSQSRATINYDCNNNVTYWMLAEWPLIWLNLAVKLIHIPGLISATATTIG